MPTPAYMFDNFFHAYLSCALWSSIDDDGEPLDGLFTIDDISEESLNQMRRDCEAFFVDYGHLFRHAEERAGHDFWLTRNRHGAGFWDRPEFYGEQEAKELTHASHAYGEAYLMVDENNWIHHA